VPRTPVRTAAGLSRLVWSYGAFGLLRHLVPLKTLARWAWRSPMTPRDPSREAATLARVVKLGHLFRRTDRHCLQRSLVLFREFSRGGADPRLVVGFRTADGRLIGHAWIEVDDRPVGETNFVQSTYVRTCAFGAGGAQTDAQGRAAG
jgi:hypothetical protein